MEDDEGNQYEEDQPNVESLASCFLLVRVCARAVLLVVVCARAVLLVVVCARAVLSLLTPRHSLSLKVRISDPDPAFLNIFRSLASLGFPLVSVCEHNDRSNTSTAAELAELKKSHNFKEKHNI